MIWIIGGSVVALVLIGLGVYVALWSQVEVHHGDPEQWPNG